jgi:hypothetical protein
MTTDPETVYRQLGRLIEAMPDLTAYPIPEEVYRWTGRAFVLVKEIDESVDAISFKMAVDNLGTTARASGAQNIKAVVYRALAIEEARAPASARGSFIPAGNKFDAFAAVSKVLQTATKDVLIVDPYMDETALTEFGTAVGNNIPFRLLADKATVKSTLVPAAVGWVQQYGAGRPLAVRLAPPKALHDRAIFIDQTTAWALTQSLKDFAARAPAEIIRADDTAALKIAAYESVWSTADIAV